MTSPSDSLAQESPGGGAFLESTPASRAPRFPLIPLLLAVLALLDLRVELQLLFDHITLTSLSEAIRNHLLAVMVLLFTPSLFRRYRR